MSGTRKTDTIDIGKGIKYAKVASRLTEFHEDNRDRCSIETTCEFKDGWALFRATITNGRGSFTGHSLGKLGGQKAFEKQETIAVGRALAFAGYLSSGDIASFEEMETAQTEGGVKTSAINELKRRWASQNAAEIDGMDKNAMLVAFGDWVQRVSGNEFDVSDFRQWRAEDMEACIADLA